jgi:hypothetical protein
MEYEELTRITSPEKTLDAVLTRSSAGAMDSFHYNVYLVTPGVEVNDNSSYVFSATRATNLNISWNGNRSLLIEYDETRIDFFTNYYYPYIQTKGDISYMVNITEINRKSNSENTSIH